jgi:hypothetical protein
MDDAPTSGDRVTRPGPQAGPPADPLQLVMGGCRLEVEGAAAHELDDTWDASWFSVTARCESAEASVAVRCAVLTSWSIERFLQGLVALERTGSASAYLASESPCLALCVRGAADAGRPQLRVDLTGDRTTQGHWFIFALDDADVGTAIGQCRAILAAYPPHELADGG